MHQARLAGDHADQTERKSNDQRKNNNSKNIYDWELNQVGKMSEAETECGRHHDQPGMSLWQAAERIAAKDHFFEHSCRHSRYHELPENLKPCGPRQNHRPSSVYREATFKRDHRQKKANCPSRPESE
jgi:hypothetical protein